MPPAADDRRAPRRAAAALLLAACGALALSGDAALGQGWYRAPPRFPTAESFDGGFNFCRGMYQGGRDWGGSGWSTDYPSADVNLSIRLSELTKTRLSRDAAGEPNHLVVRLTDDALYQCPFVLMAEVGSVYFDDEEVAALRSYFLKGGFLWVDDFWGSRAWAVWAREIGKVLPPSQYPIADVPGDHALFRTLFEVPGVPQIPSIQFWRGTGGATSEFGSDSAEPRMRAIADDRGRVMVLMTHNTDIADAWEREGEDPDYFYQFSVDGYAVAINVVLYAMTH